jgi:hypothetical protein
MQRLERFEEDQLKLLVTRCHSTTVRRAANDLLAKLARTPTATEDESPKKKRRPRRGGSRGHSPGSGEADYLKPVSTKYDMPEYDAHHFGRM